MRGILTSAIAGLKLTNNKTIPITAPNNEAFVFFTTWSILPFVEWRPWGLNQVTPYLLFSFGGNINSYKVSSLVNTGCIVIYGVGCEVTVDNTFALKGGGEIDLFITKDLALNAEAAWKRNSGNSQLFIGGVGMGEEKFNNDVLGFSTLLNQNLV